MADLSLDIRKNLILLRGKPANHLTHAFKVIGKGSMVEGAIKIVDQLNLEKNKCVFKARYSFGIGGLLIGASTTCGIWLYTKTKEKVNKASEDIVRAFEEEVIISKNNL